MSTNYCVISTSDDTHGTIFEIYNNYQYAKSCVHNCVDAQLDLFKPACLYIACMTDDEIECFHLQCTPLPNEYIPG